MSISYTVSIPQLPALRAAFAEAPDLTKAAITTAANKSLLAYQGTAKQLAPVDSGYLRGSIQITPFTWTGNNGQGSVGPSQTKYAVFQEVGTGIYGPAHTPIVPKTKPMLAWYAGGKWHFAKSVRGAKPHWYMKGSLEANQGRTEANFQMALDSVAEAIAGGVGR